ncbi:SymE family type I addiction module toxin [Paraburkholderia sp. JHI869]|uniref:SymE family type I addiction module toxin n=1 Tax=Paraburkholderia sp. JHI869 TaxID=3112959 RepID=UPI00317F4179
MSVTSAHSPLTKTNSQQELTMADANLNASRAHPERRVTIQQSWRYRSLSSRARTDPPLYPWLKLSGRWLELAGFEAGQRVRVTVENKRLVITLD